MKTHLCNILYVISFDMAIASIFALRFNDFQTVSIPWNTFLKALSCILMFSGIFGTCFLYSQVDFSQFNKSESSIWRLCSWVSVVFLITSFCIPLTLKSIFKVVFEFYMALFILFQLYLFAKRKL